MDNNTLKKFPTWIQSAPLLNGGVDSNLLVLNEGKGNNLDDLLVATYLATKDVGVHVNLEYYDDKHNSDYAKKTALNMDKFNVGAVVGHYSSVAAIAASKIYNKKNILFITPGASHPGLSLVDNSTTLRFFGNDKYLLDCFCDPILEQHKVLIIAQLGNNAESLAEAILSRFPHHKSIMLITLDTENITQEKLSLNNNFDIVYLLGSQNFTIHVAKTYDFHGAKIIFSDDAYGVELLQFSQQYLGEVCIPFLEIKEKLIFSRLYLDLIKEGALLLGRKPSAYFLTSYLAIRAICEAWKIYPDLRGKDLYNYIAQQKYITPYGNLSVSRTGELIGLDWFLYDGKKILI